MNFPEGRLYTLQLTADELAHVCTTYWEQDAFWQEGLDNPGGTVDTLMEKIGIANSIRQQDLAVAYLRQSAEDRCLRLEEAIRGLRKHVRNLEGG